MLAVFDKTLRNQWQYGLFCLALLCCFIIYAPGTQAKNLPKTIEHDHSTTQADQPAAQLEQQRHQAERETERARQNLQRSRQDSRRFVPSQDSHASESLRADSEFIRSQQELRNAEGNQYALERRIESAERDARLQRDREAARSSRSDVQRSYPKIEYGHRR